jgi:hypothetical protein
VPEEPRDQQDTLFEQLERERALERSAKEPGSFLLKYLVDEQAELAGVPLMELGDRMATLVIAAAVRQPAMTPRGVLDELLENVPGDEEWGERVEPELRRVLAERGVEFGP